MTVQEKRACLIRRANCNDNCEETYFPSTIQKKIIPTKVSTAFVPTKVYTTKVSTAFVPTKVYTKKVSTASVPTKVYTSKPTTTKYLYDEFLQDYDKTY